MRISGKRKAICAALLLLSAVANSPAGERIDIASIDNRARPQITNQVIPPVVKETYEYYAIKGNSEDELRSEMCRNGCKWRDGKTYDSVTDWRVKWDYEYGQARETCSAESFKVFVDITFRYPKWNRPDDAPGPLAAKWDNYMKSLVEHETGHRDMAVAAAAELSRAIAVLPPVSTCAELDRAVKSLCHKRLSQLNADAKEYDESTHHGSIQGAVFP